MDTFLDTLLINGPHLGDPERLARWLPAAFKDGLDGDALDGAVHLVYDIPAIQVEYVRHEEPVLNTGFWRGMGTSLAFGVSHTRDADGWIVALADMPHIQPQTIIALARSIGAGASLAAPYFAGQRGHPVA